MQRADSVGVLAVALHLTGCLGPPPYVGQAGSEAGSEQGEKPAVLDAANAEADVTSEVPQPNAEALLEAEAMPEVEVEVEADAMPDAETTPDAEVEVETLPDAQAEAKTMPDAEPEMPEAACDVVACEAAGGPCLELVFDVSGCACVAVPNADGSPCDDGDPCTLDDACNKGICQPGTPLSCDDGNACTADSCTQGAGCINPSIDCDDGNACTADSCTQGAGCINPVIDCEDGNPCTLVGCDPATGCLQPVPLAAPCDDGSLCTQKDECQGGQCQGTSPVVCVASGACHQAGTCDPTTGKCSDPPMEDGSPCQDGDLCTTSDTCQGGQCQGTSPVVCVASGACHQAGICDPTTGECSDPVAPDGSECSVGDDLCTYACKWGNCEWAGESELSCDDGDPCTIDENWCKWPPAGWITPCGHTHVCLSVEVIDASEGTVASSDIQGVQVYDAGRDPLGSAWKKDAGADWYVQAGEQLLGRSLVLGRNRDLDGCGTPDAAPSVNLPLPSPMAPPFTLTFWVRAAGVAPKQTSCSGELETPPVQLIVRSPSWVTATECNPQNVVHVELDLGSWGTSCIKQAEEASAAQPCTSSLVAGASAAVDLEPIPPTHPWRHLAIVVAPKAAGVNETTIYVDGAEVSASSTLANAVPVPIQELTLSVQAQWLSGDGAAPFDTFLDEVRAYDQKLSLAQIGAEVSAGKLGQADDMPIPPVARWTFDPGSSPFTGGKVSDRSSEAEFPAVAYLVQTVAGLDILDATTRQLWMRVRADSAGWDGYLAGTGLYRFDAMQGVVAWIQSSYFASTGHHLTAMALWVDPYKLHNAYQWGGDPLAETLGLPLGCRNDPCFYGMGIPYDTCKCSEYKYSGVACRNGDVEPKFGSSLGSTTPSPGLPTSIAAGVMQCPGDPDPPVLVVTGAASSGNPASQGVWGWKQGGFALDAEHRINAEVNGWSDFTHLAAAGSTLYAVVRRYDGSCSQLLVIDDFFACTAPCNPTGWECWSEKALRLGSLGTTPPNLGPASCGSPPIEAMDLKAQILPGGTHRVVLTTTAYVSVLDRKPPDAAASWSLSVHTSPAEPQQNKYGAWPNTLYPDLPTGFFAAVACGQRLYVAGNGVSQTFVEANGPIGAPGNPWLEPILPSTTILGIDCTTEGPPNGAVRVLVATMAGLAIVDDCDGANMPDTLTCYWKAGP